MKGFTISNGLEKQSFNVSYRSGVYTICRLGNEEIKSKYQVELSSPYRIAQQQQSCLDLIQILFLAAKMAYYQQDMLSIKSRSLLAHVLAQVVLLSESIQCYREALASISFFDCVALFRFLDREEKGYLREKDFQRIMGTSHRKLLSYAFSWMDNMKVGEISRLEFACFLLPKDNLELRQLVAERVEHPSISYSQHETIMEQFDIFRQMIVQIMNREMKIIEMRRELINSSDYSSRGALVAIDGYNHNYASAEDLLKFMKNFGFDVNLRQVEKLAEVISCSLDGKITEEQLRWIIQGFESSNKTYLKKIKASNKKVQAKVKRDNPESPKKEVAKAAKEDDDELKTSFCRIVEKMKLAQFQEQQIDEQLKKYQFQSIQTNKKLCDERLLMHNQKKMLAQKLKEQEQKKRIVELQAIRKEKEARLYREIDIQREAELLKQAQRLKNIQNILYNPSTIPAKQGSKRLYSFAEESPQNYTYKREFQIIDAHIPRRDYTNLTNLNSLSIVESYRKASERSSINTFELSEDTAYFTAAERIKDRIREQRVLEREIQERLNREGINSNRFSSKAPATESNPSFIKSLKSSELQPEITSNSQQIFESPDRKHNFSKSNKFTVSTGNKLSEQKA